MPLTFETSYKINPDKSGGGGLESAPDSGDFFEVAAAAEKASNILAKLYISGLHTRIARNRRLEESDIDHGLIGGLRTAATILANAAARGDREQLASLLQALQAFEPANR